MSNLIPVTDVERMARAVAASKLFGVQSPEAALALMLIAQAEGRHPASAAGDYHIIQGRPAKKADAMLRDFLSAGGKVRWVALTDERAEAEFSHPAGGTVSIAWDMARARKAGLGGKDMWGKFPRQMLRSRVVSEGIRTVFPGATSGMYVPEEAPDMPAVDPMQDARIIEAEQLPAPAMPEDQLLSLIATIESAPDDPTVREAGRKALAVAREAGDRDASARITQAALTRLSALKEAAE